MKTNVPIEFDDDTRARIRAFNGKGGLATRSEIKAFVLEELAESVKQLPEPKRCKAAAKASPASVDVDQVNSALDRSIAATKDAIAAIRDQKLDDVCKKCGEKRRDHERQKFCRVSRTVKPGSKFELLTELSS